MQAFRFCLKKYFDGFLDFKLARWSVYLKPLKYLEKYESYEKMFRIKIALHREEYNILLGRH